jgi:putative membrane protein
MTGESRALSDADRERIEAAIAALETRTSAELAVVVARQAHDYAAYPFLWSAALGLFAGGALAVAFPAVRPIDVILVEGVVFALAYLALHFTPLGIALVPAHVKRAHARRLAAAEFASIVAQRTADRAGVLLFVSLAERHVEILVDRGVDAAVGPNEWPAIVERFRAAEGGTLADRLVAATQACASILERHLPPRPGQRNESPDWIKEI